MVTPGPASIVVVPFPFSDLSATKLRPAVVLADASRGDWLLCQITSNPYSDQNAVPITNRELQSGVLSSTVSFARPLKLFTANETLMNKRVAILKDETFKEILMATVALLQRNMPI
ncbi:MAG: type II toxin-antitoxin system PemK/MazF family toxin [Caldilineaceae bacterium]|nr:type II toxin-antitoxin system PemK/MazF family toxin [Caldilineaceae bacterium]